MADPGAAGLMSSAAAAAAPTAAAAPSSMLSAPAMPTNMPLNDTASAPLPLGTNTPDTVYTEHNLSLRVPATIQLPAWHNRPASDVLEDGRRAVRGGGNVLGAAGVPRPFANYDWTRYSDDIGSLFGYFWLMLFSVQYGAVRGGSVSADTIQQAWRFFQRQTKPWFERAGSAAVAWMDTAVRRVSNEGGGAAAQLDNALRSLQTIYLTDKSVRVSFERETNIHADQRNLVAAYDAQIRNLAAAAGVDLGGNSVMLDVLQQLVVGGQHAAQTQPALMLAAMLPSAPLLQLMRQTTAANPGAEKALRAALERAGKLEADVVVQKSTIKTLKDTLAASKDAGKMRDLEVAVSDYRKTATTAAELKEMRTALRQAETNLAAAAQAAVIRPELIDELRRVAPGAGVSDAAYQATAAKLAETRAELAVAKMTVQTLSESKLARKAQELQDSVDRAQAELRDLRAGAATAAELKALRTEIQAAASDVAQRSLASYVITDDIVQQLRQSAAPGPRKNDPLVVASQKRLTNEGKLLAELEVQRGRNNELAAQLRRAEAKITTLQARLSSASAAASSSGSPSASIADPTRQLMMLREDNRKPIAENKEKNAQNAKLKKDLDDRSRSSATVALASASSPSLSTVAPASSATSDADLSRLRAEHERAMLSINVLDADIRAKNAEIVAKNAEIERLRAMLDPAVVDARSKNLQRQIDDLSAANRALANDVGDKQAKVEELTTLTSVQSQTIAELQAAEVGLAAELEGLGRELETLTDVNAELRQRVRIDDTHLCHVIAPETLAACRALARSVAAGFNPGIMVRSSPARSVGRSGGAKSSAAPGT